MGVGEIFLTEEEEDAKLLSWEGVKVEEAEGKTSGFNGTLRGLGEETKRWFDRKIEAGFSKAASSQPNTQKHSLHREIDF